MPDPGMYGRLGRVPRRVKSNRTVQSPTSAGSPSALGDFTGGSHDGSGGTFTLPSSIQVGDLMLLWVKSNSADTLHTADGWTNLWNVRDLHSSNEADVSAWYKVVTAADVSAGESSFTVDNGGANGGRWACGAMSAPTGVSFTETPPEGNLNTANSQNPPAISPSFAPATCRIVTVYHGFGADEEDVPDGYTHWGFGFDTRLNVATKLIDVTVTEDPGSYSGSTTGSTLAGTIAVLAEGEAPLATGDHTHTEDEVDDIDSLSQKATPVSADRVKIYDSEDSDTFKYAELGDLPGGGGGGGAVAAGVSAIIGDKSGDIQTTSTTYVDLTGISVSIGAVAGDLLEISFMCVHDNSGTGNADLFVANVSGTGVIDPATAVTDWGSGSHVAPLLAFHTVQAGDISGGNVTVKIQWRVTGGTGTVTNESTFNRAPVMVVKNYGQ